MKPLKKQTVEKQIKINSYAPALTENANEDIETAEGVCLSALPFGSVWRMTYKVPCTKLDDPHRSIIIERCSLDDVKSFYGRTKRCDTILASHTFARILYASAGILPVRYEWDAQDAQSVQFVALKGKTMRCVSSDNGYVYALPAKYCWKKKKRLTDTDANKWRLLSGL